ncbi:Sec1-like protein [Fistulina hepatica ATCC 64428]|uniref:Sec1-like protein n=1 Tax=Fistulina hepatica ATCC 64428 TaxID=1128425 RepID=A0A0D7A6E5_9AGAR|nr:Sec1-like protein [Fistulina hepatica ATCC 64428]
MSGHDGQNSSSTTQDGLDLSPFKEMAKTRLIATLNSVNGAKTLVLDASLAGPLGLITEVSLLKHHGVDKMFWLEAGPLTSTTTNIVYLCRPLIKHVKVIADQIKRHAKESQVHNYTVFLVPRVSTLVSHILEEEGVLGDVTLAPYELQFIPIADDVLSLEHDAAFKELWVDGDETIIFDSAQALHTLQLMYGLFPRIVGKGDYAYRLSTLLTRNVPKTANASTPELLLAPSSNIDSLIILDRRVDMITPLLTQLTYEGLIDELIGIKNSHVELPVTLASPPQNNTTQPVGGQPVAGPSSAPPPPAATLRKENKKKHLLTATTDPLYAEIRDLNFSVIGKRLNQVARRLDEDYKTRLQAETVAQLKDFVGKLGGLQSEHQSLRLHTGLSELLVPMTRTDHFNRSLEIQQNLLASYEVSAQISAVEEMIAQEADMQTVIRLLCLASIIAGGIKAKVLENLKREILQSYGYTCLPMLLSLAAPPLAVLLPNPLPPTTPVTVANTKLPFSSVRKSLRLLIDDDPQALGEVDNDISFVYSGYAPISVRLVQCVAQKGGVLSNPAEREKCRTEDATNNGLGKVQAHPISGWKGFEDVLAAIPGKTFDIVQKPPRGAGPDVPSKAPPFSKNHVTTTVVFFLGGCTYTEIAALRWVGRQNRGRKFLIATTGMVSGSGLVNSIAGLGSTPTSRDAGL